MSDAAAAIAAAHFDGRTALCHLVQVVLEEGSLRLVESGEIIPIAHLRACGDRARPSFRRVDLPGWRIDLIDPMPAVWASRLPAQEYHGALLDRFGVKVVLGATAVFAVGAIYVLAIGSVALARLVPVRWEMALGDRLSGGLDNRACAARDGRAALDHLARELGSDDVPIRITVADVPLVNAAALPGRQIVIFQGLIDAARSPDEVAGVLAHEIGHVEYRHPLIALVRGYGLSLLIGGLDGGAVMQTLLANRYSRGDERDADREAVARLGRAGISPDGIADFFDRMAAREGGTGAMIETFLSTHPLSAERRRAFLASRLSHHAYRPALGPADWVALKTICAR